MRCDHCRVDEDPAASRAGDIFRRRLDGLEIQLTRKLCGSEWHLREVGTMKRIEWHELRATAAAA